ncbi:hypothetical protein [Streptomyces sp. NPDC051561]|uniref:hypothetical protein n=1 Tax=Streptomyces sp. NPDC051561 TaxID=3365658 RepID=UPI00378B9D2E
MGDYFQTIVDTEARAEEAPELAARLISKLIEDGIIAAAKDSLVYTGAEGPGDHGHGRGPNWVNALHADEEWEFSGGVVPLVGRETFLEGQGESEAEYAKCPRCGERTTFIDYPESFEADQELWEPFGQALEAWQEGGSGEVACPSCAVPSPVDEWTWASDFAMGALALDFWNWPQLSDAFVERVGRELGHRVVLISGKL